jgi:hypothetical protein
VTVLDDPNTIVAVVMARRAEEVVAEAEEEAEAPVAEEGEPEVIKKGKEGAEEEEGAKKGGE